jgi:hypothetical protein
VILALGSAHFVLYPFEFEAPLIVQAFTLLLDVRDGAETELQGGRFQSTQQFLDDQVI